MINYNEHHVLRFPKGGRSIINRHNCNLQNTRHISLFEFITTMWNVIIIFKNRIKRNEVVTLIYQLMYITVQ